MVALALAGPAFAQFNPGPNPITNEQSSALFLSLMDVTTIDGLHTNVNLTAPVPLPGALWLMASRLGILAAARPRRNASRESHPAVIQT